MTKDKIVKTSEKDWLEKALKLFTEKEPFQFIDDAGLKLTEKDMISAVTLIRALKSKGGATWQKIAGALSGIGITGVGVYMIAAAIADPEPTTKLGLLIGGGIILALTGSLGTLAALGFKFKVSVKSSKGDIEIFLITPENDA